MKMFDTHAHLDLPDLHKKIKPLIERLRNGVFPDGVFAPAENLEMRGVLLPGITGSSSEKCVALARENRNFLFAGVAVHPNSLAKMEPGDWERIVSLADDPVVVAIGETGLDRYWDKTPFDMQVDYFNRHIELARAKSLPILIHCREAVADMMPILREKSKEPGLFGVIHAFSDDKDIALECVELGFHISFAGSLTFTNKKFDPIREAAKAVPLERLLIETDSPYLTPHPYRGKHFPNEPLLVSYVAKTMAEIREVSLEEIIQITTRNAERLFTATANPLR